MNDYIKSFKQFYLTESLKAEDYEAAVVIGWYKNNRKKFDVGETCVLDDLDIPVVEFSAPSILLRDFREKRRFWKQLVELEAFLHKAS